MSVCTDRILMLPVSVNAFPSSAVTATGACCAFSERFSAVTTTSSSCPESPPLPADVACFDWSGDVAAALSSAKTLQEIRPNNTQEHVTPTADRLRSLHCSCTCYPRFYCPTMTLVIAARHQPLAYRSW